MELLAVKRVRGVIKGGCRQIQKKSSVSKKRHVDGQTRQRRVFPLVYIYKREKVFICVCICSL